MKTTKIKVSERALLARINRKLIKDLELVKKCREDSRGWHNVGSYYQVDLQTNGIIGTHLNLEQEAKEAGLLKPYEELA